MGHVNDTHCLLKRPGGYDITSKAVSLCGFRKDETILDLGCGSGATVEFLISHYGFNALGLEISPGINAISDRILQGNAAILPFPDHMWHGIMMECSFSLMESPEAVLQECHRVLKPEGRLIISDMYAKGKPARLPGYLGFMNTKEQLCSILEANGFTPWYFEDFTREFQDYWGQMIFDMGKEAFYSGLCVDPELLRKVKCGYCLILAEKESVS
ncbi:MAG: class I SAM-dependent methyltransferase [Bacteroidales bacterium]|nr:methyltransferase domain-containing protein [Lentimicrobiaceae bacterium]MDD5695447.1 class I SAM-dependent methyltransferase [Bacteroidales bacterium]